MSKSKFNAVFSSMFEFISANVSIDPDRPNGYKLHKKKECKAACCHIMLRDTGKRSSATSEPKVMIEDDDVNGTSHCVICGRTFPTPDINIDNLRVLQHAAGIINGALMLLPWSNIGKEEARLSLECRNLLEQFNILYESAVNDLAIGRQPEIDTTIKSHVSHL